jgi:hypothetical protein
MKQRRDRFGALLAFLIGFLVYRALGAVHPADQALWDKLFGSFTLILVAFAIMISLFKVRSPSLHLSALPDPNAHRDHEHPTHPTRLSA